MTGMKAYRPFRTTAEEASEDALLAREFEVNPSWLVRYFYKLGKSVFKRDALVEAADADPRSTPKKKKGGK